MLATLIRALLVLEAALYWAAGAWLREVRGWDLATLVLLAAATALGVRLALVCVTMLLAWWARSPRAPDQQLGVAGTARLVLGEWCAMLAYNFFYLPFEAAALEPDRDAGHSEMLPVLLVHGYFSNRGLFRSVAAALSGGGIRPVFAFTFRGVFVPIESYVDQLESEVRRALSATGQERVVLVCHSMGGLIARAWMARHGAQRVAHLVTVATPHHGTVLARLTLGANAVQMRPHSDFLRALARHEGEGGPGCPATSLYSVHDNVVSPQDSSRLRWADNRALKGLGHVAILLSPALHGPLVEVVRKACARPPA